MRVPLGLGIPQGVPSLSGIMIGGMRLSEIRRGVVFRHVLIFYPQSWDKLRLADPVDMTLRGSTYCPISLNYTGAREYILTGL